MSSPDLEKELEIWKGILDSPASDLIAMSLKVRALTIIPIIEELQQWRNKDIGFINHIQSHLLEDQIVICKICGKAASEIEAKK